jgi:hypothetical protein
LTGARIYVASTSAMVRHHAAGTLKSIASRADMAR